MKRVILLTLVLALCLVPCLALAGGTVHTSNEQGLSIVCLDGWTLKKGPANDRDLIFVITKNGTQDNILITAIRTNTPEFDRMSNQQMSGYLESMTNGALQDLGSNKAATWALQDKGVTVIGGKKAVYMSLICIDASGGKAVNYKTQQFKVINNGVRYVITCTSSLDNFEKNKAEFQFMVSSFKFI